jgi:hypothetical protein
MSKQQIYISGKMRGMDEQLSRKLFQDAEDFLTKHGFIAHNPWKFVHTSERWGDRIIADLELLKSCDGIWMLENWRDSNGATCEYYFARGEGLKFMGPHS